MTNEKVIESPLFNSHDAAHYLDMHEGTLANWRVQGIGPTYVRVGSNVRYLKADLDSWLQAQRVVYSS
jgi:hypothetical protein